MLYTASLARLIRPGPSQAGFFANCRRALEIRAKVGRKAGLGLHSRPPERACQNRLR